MLLELVLNMDSYLSLPDCALGHVGIALGPPALSQGKENIYGRLWDVQTLWVGEQNQAQVNVTLS